MDESRLLRELNDHLNVHHALGELSAACSLERPHFEQRKRLPSLQRASYSDKKVGFRSPSKLCGLAPTYLSFVSVGSVTHTNSIKWIARHTNTHTAALAPQSVLSR